MTLPTRLPATVSFQSYPVLELNEGGSFVDRATREVVPARQVQHYLRRALRVDRDVTDIFVWVHGWRNDSARATAAATRLFKGIEVAYAAQPERYSGIRNFKGMYVAVCWPSRSAPLPQGYAKIRDRAHSMTEEGYAEYFLASLLGYLDERRHQTSRPSGILRTGTGQYLHCIGHSFGGRFLAQAIAAAAAPSPATLPLMPKNQRFEFTVDNFLVFQMAARPDIFNGRLRVLVDDAPLQGPICLTYSNRDRANCLWHKIGEGEQGIGCIGATAPADRMKTVRLRPSEEDYSRSELTAPIINVDAGWRYRRGGWLAPEGAHSDFWYEESIHLLLTLVSLAR